MVLSPGGKKGIVFKLKQKRMSGRKMLGPHLSEINNWTDSKRKLTINFKLFLKFLTRWFKAFLEILTGWF